MNKKVRKAQEALEKELSAVLANIWNLGGMVGIAALEPENADKLWDVAQINGLSQVQRAFNRYMEDTKDA